VTDQKQWKEDRDWTIGEKVETVTITLPITLTNYCSTTHILHDREHKIMHWTSEPVDED